MQFLWSYSGSRYSTTCPKCGSPTPYIDSVSGTYDSTMIASSADPPHQALPSETPMGPLPSYAEPLQVGTQYSSRGQPQYKSQGWSPTGMPNASRSGLSSPTRTIGSVPMLLFIALTCLVILAACGSTQSYPPSAPFLNGTIIGSGSVCERKENRNA